MSVIIETERFTLSSLTTGDVTETYLNWFDNKEVQKFISYKKTTINELKAFVRERENKEDVLFLAIKTKDGHHIGNIKYEPIDFNEKYAVFGILIGETSWRGKGVFKEVFVPSYKYIKEQLGIQKVYLGVGDDNPQAVGAYKSIGFKESKLNILKLKPCSLIELYYEN